ncbi:hypothetical protein CJU89_1351 [Yarrowia sp. B02]|nr:hypothetical protein CJU89_1351 [Yarrowia sp. B02]
MNVTSIFLDHSRQNDHVESVPEMIQTPSGMAIVEIQGEVVSKAHLEEGSRRVGTIEFAGKSAIMIIDGKQRMRGSIKKLDKPLGLLKMDPERRHQVDLIEIVTHKVSFTDIPEPVGADE